MCEKPPSLTVIKERRDEEKKTRENVDHHHHFLSHTIHVTNCLPLSQENDTLTENDSPKFFFLSSLMKRRL